MGEVTEEGWEPGNKLPAERAKTWLRWPMLFSMQPADVSMLSTSKHLLDVSHEYDAEPAVVQHTFFGFVGEPPWSPGFMGVDWWTPARELKHAVLDELYAFMAMRVVVTEYVPGERVVAHVSRWSLPMASRMAQLVETTARAGGGTILRYRVAFEPPWLAAPFVPIVAGIFKAWFRASLRGLERYLKTQAKKS